MEQGPGLEFPDGSKLETKPVGLQLPVAGVPALLLHESRLRDQETRHYARDLQQDRLDYEAIFEDKTTTEISPELPPGSVAFGEYQVESVPIALPGRQATCYIRGKFDTVVRFDDRS